MKDVQKYCIQHSEEIRRNLTHFVISSDAGKLHDFRASVKKLRAAFSLSEESVQKLGKYSKAHDSLRRIYKVTSEMRDADVTMELITTIRAKPEKILPQLKKRRDEQFNNFKGLYLKIRKKLNRELKDVADKRSRIKTSEVTDALLYTLFQADVALLSGETAEDLHYARKSLKQAMVYAGFLTERKLKELGLDMDKADVIQSSIGNYLDVVFAMKMLKDNRSLTSVLGGVLNKRITELNRAVSVYFNN